MEKVFLHKCALKSAGEPVQVPTGERKPADGAWLDEMSPEKFVRSRRLAVAKRKTGDAEWICGACAYPAYPSQHPMTGLRHFRHFAGAPIAALGTTTPNSK
jgi:hypothetical protein